VACHQVIELLLISPGKLMCDVALSTERQRSSAKYVATIHVHQGFL
jgi:hypothetical protein